MTSTTNGSDEFNLNSGRLASLIDESIKIVINPMKIKKKVFSCVLINPLIEKLKSKIKRNEEKKDALLNVKNKGKEG